MTFFRNPKSFLGYLKLHYIKSRSISGTQSKITSSYHFMPGDIMLSSFRIGDVIDQSADKCGDRMAVISVHQNISKTYTKLRYEGTTGTPKGAVLSHHNVVNNALLSGYKYGFNLKNPMSLCHLPLFHSFGCVQASLATHLFQGTCVLPSSGFDAVASLKTVEKHKCSIIFGTPTMYFDLIRNFKSDCFAIASLKQAVVGGAAPTANLMRDLKEVLGISDPMVGYGATETSPAISVTRRGDYFENIANGVMKLIEYVEVKIVDIEGQVVPVNTQGELCARGHITFLGYWNEERKTAEVLDKSRWYHTGDLATMNEYGLIKIVGRIKEMIIRGGENIYPQEVENFLNSHPSILEVHVCGVPDQRLGEEACAWICLKQGKNLTEEQLKEFCKGKISHHKIPRYLIFVSDFPKTQSGKVKKFEMSKISIEKLKL